MSFIDENCIVFDNEEENKLEYTTIHNVSNPFLTPLGVQETCGGAVGGNDG